MRRAERFPGELIPATTPREVLDGEGWETHQIRCGTCGDPVDWIVQNAAGARRTRLKWMLATWGVIIGIPAISVGAALSPTPAILLLVIPLFYVGGRLLRRSIPRWVAAHGVRIEDGRPDGFGPHSLRVPSGANRRQAAG